MKTYFPYIFGLILLVALDAISKHFALSLIANPIYLVGDFLSFEYAKNTGIAFSFPLTGLALKIVTVILIFGIFYYYISVERHKKSTLLKLSYMLIIAGALGNAWERILRGFVTDFISVKYFSVFNLADSYITLGAIGLIYFYYFSNTTCKTDQEM